MQARTEPKAKTVRLPKARASYPDFGGTFNEEKKKMEYSVGLLFPKGADLTEARKLAFQAGAAKWGPDRSKWPQNLMTPFRDQAEKEYKQNDDGSREKREGYEPGAFFCTPRSGKRPGLMDRDAKTPISDITKFYGGCWVVCVVHFYAFEHRNNKGQIVKRGIGCGLDAVQFAGDDKPFGGLGVDLETAFVPMDDEGGAEAGSVAEDQFI